MKMAVIIKRELSSYFSTPIAYVFIFIFPRSSQKLLATKNMIAGMGENMLEFVYQLYL